jgi:hypothetical protein
MVLPLRLASKLVDAVVRLASLAVFSQSSVEGRADYELHPHPMDSSRASHPRDLFLTKPKAILPKAAKDTRVPSLDGLRGIAALAVMEFHFALFYLPQANLLKIVPFLSRAYLSVDLFFLISGFVMAHVYGLALATNWRTQWPTFAAARFARLYPALAVTTLVILIVVLLSQPPTRLVSFSGHALALQPFLLQQWASGLN